VSATAGACAGAFAVPAVVGGREGLGPLLSDPHPDLSGKGPVFRVFNSGLVSGRRFGDDALLDNSCGRLGESCNGGNVLFSSFGSIITRSARPSWYGGGGCCIGEGDSVAFFGFVVEGGVDAVRNILWRFGDGTGESCSSSGRGGNFMFFISS